jgi:predicted MPP superfamily phosphohydrolase
MNLKSSIVCILVLFTFFITIGQAPKIYEISTYNNSWNQPSQFPDRIILNAGANAKTEVGVNWRTDTTVNTSYLEYVKEDDAPKFWRNSISLKANTSLLDGSDITLSNIKAHFHSVSIKGLEPGVTYIYRVGSENAWSEWFQFKTVHQTNGNLKILFIGDVQNNIYDLGSRLIRQAYKQNGDSDLIIYSGDLINYAHKDVEWEEWFKMGGFIHASVPSVMTPGNHEYNFRNSEDEKANNRVLSAQWKPQFTLPENGPEELKESAYYIDYDQLKVICINSNVKSKNQWVWLDKVLSENQKKWTILFFHHPVFPTVIGRTFSESQEYLQPLLTKYKIDLVLTGHDHAYSRGVSKDVPFSVFVVSVSGGKMYNMNKGWEAYGGIRQRSGENVQLYQVINLSTNVLSFTTYTATGKIYDQFQIKKKKSKTKFKDLSGSIREKTHKNTTPYYDQLPEHIEKELLIKYPGYQINRTAIIKKDGQLVYEVRLRRDNAPDVYLVIDSNGNSK